MADGKKINNNYNKRHLLRLKLYEKRVQALLDAATAECAALGISVSSKLGDKPFSFDKFPNTKRKFDDIINQVAKGLLAAVVNGVNAEWELANDKNDKLCDLVFSRLNGKLTSEEKKAYYKNNSDALEAFRERVTAGMKLSDRVWKYTSQYKTEIELALDCGIRDGVAASKMATELKQYLQYPDKLFRRVRGKDGILRLSKAAAAFHPSTGVYRSSYKNAMRLARTETNMAYRAADHNRYQQLFFVLGIQIHLSNNHTCLGRDGKPHPFTDICDELAGVYPKDFKFVGWHPQCRCFVTSVLMSDEEVDKARAARRAGKEYKSPNEIKDVPEAFKQYLKDHKESIDKAANKPYWCMDNYKYTGYGEPPQPAAPAAPTPAQIAAQRHAARTPEQIEAIKNAWETRKQAIENSQWIQGLLKDIPDVDLSKLQQYEATAQWDKVEKEAKALFKIQDDLKYNLEYIDDGFAEAKKYGYQSVMDTDAAIKAKLKMLKSQCSYDDYDAMSTTDLAYMKKKLSFEAKYVEHPEQYKSGAVQKPTWELAQNAYNKELEKVVKAEKFLILRDKLYGWQGLHLNDKYFDYLLTKFGDYLKSEQYDEAEALIPDIENQKSLVLLVKEFKSNQLEEFKTKSKNYADWLSMFQTAVVLSDYPMAKKYYDKLVDYKEAVELKQNAITDVFVPEAYTQERKDNAYWFKRPEDADKAFRPAAGAAWQSATAEERDSIYRYTAGSSFINEPYRKISYLGGKGNDGLKAGKDIENIMYQFDHDMWVQRGVDKNVFQIVFGADLDSLYSSGQLDTLIGKEGVDLAFSSTGACKGTGFRRAVIYNIYCPRGTKGFYCEPFSCFGNGAKKSWDGKSEQKDLGDELEILLKNGSRFRITKAVYNARDNKYYVDLELIGQA